MYLMTNKQGISARSLSKQIEVAYDTAFNLLHKLRAAMSSHDAKYLLSGHVQMDESYLGGHSDREHRRGRARDTKRVVGVAVEQRGPNQSGYIHLEALPSASSESLHGMILDKIKQGAHLHTDGWTGYQGIAMKGYDHLPMKSPGGLAASHKWPLVHRAASNLCSWLILLRRIPSSPNYRLDVQSPVVTICITQSLSATALNKEAAMTPLNSYTCRK